MHGENIKIHKKKKKKNYTLLFMSQRDVINQDENASSKFTI